MKADTIVQFILIVTADSITNYYIRMYSKVENVVSRDCRFYCNVKA